MALISPIGQTFKSALLSKRQLEIGNRVLCAHLKCFAPRNARPFTQLPLDIPLALFDSDDGQFVATLSLNRLLSLRMPSLLQETLIQLFKNRVLVVTPSADVARRAGEPISCGPGGRVQPCVLGPDAVTPIRHSRHRCARAGANSGW